MKRNFKTKDAKEGNEAHDEVDNEHNESQLQDLSQLETTTSELDASVTLNTESIVEQSDSKEEKMDDSVSHDLSPERQEIATVQETENNEMNEVNHQNEGLLPSDSEHDDKKINETDVQIPIEEV